MDDVPKRLDDYHDGICHPIDVRDDGDGPEPCICPFDTNKVWLQWKRTRVYECTLHCKSHVFSDTKIHDPKYRYDEICPTPEEVSEGVS